MGCCHPKDGSGGDNRPSLAAKGILGSLNLWRPFRDCVSVHDVLFLLARSDLQRKEYNQRNTLQEQNTTRGIFSARLREIMKSRGTTQVELAAAVGVTQAAVSKWLNGAIPKGDQLLALARSFGVTMDWLLTGEEPKTPVFAQWNRGFYVACCSYAPELIKESHTHDEDGQFVNLPDEKPTGTMVIFRFHPTGHPAAMSRDEQIEFADRYACASVDERRRMLCLGSGTERFFSDRTLGAVGVVMLRQLEEPA